MDSDDEDAPMPPHINSAKAAHDEMERRRRSRERKAKVAKVAGAILPEPMPPGRGLLDLTDEQRRGLEIQLEAGRRLRNSFMHGGADLTQTLSSVSSVAPSIEQTSIRNLEPIFKKFTDSEVGVYAVDDQPIGPRIGITDVPEPTLKALAGVVVQQRARISDRRWFIVGGGLLALVTGVVAWILRGVLGV